MRLHVQSYRQWCDTIVSESTSLLLGYHLLQCLHTKHTHAQFCAIGHWQRWHAFIFAFSKGDIATCLHFKAGASLTWWSSDRFSTSGSVSAFFCFQAGFFLVLFDVLMSLCSVCTSFISWIHGRRPQCAAPYAIGIALTYSMQTFLVSKSSQMICLGSC